MFMVASSVVTTIMILNYHHRQADTHEMPAWVSLTCSDSGNGLFVKIFIYVQFCLKGLSRDMELAFDAKYG
jgi:hypothetical protein